MFREVRSHGTAVDNMTSLLTSVFLIAIMVLALVFMGWFLLGLFGEAPRSSGARKAGFRDRRMP